MIKKTFLLFFTLFFFSLPAWALDMDSDGFSAGSTPTTDCNDSDASIHPGATETCDGEDDNCDGTIDEGVSLTWYADTDGDGYGDSSSSLTACSALTGYVADSTDCNDALASISPDATESCNSIDDDCDGSVDEGVTNTYYRDLDADSYGRGGVSIASCSATAPTGYASARGDCNDNNSGVVPGAPDAICNGVDNDCDGLIDEDKVDVIFYQDADGDGYGEPTITTTTCDGTIPTGYVFTVGDCDDSNSAIFPEATETCNSSDDNCNGSEDEGFDVDSDGIANCNDTETCDGVDNNGDGGVDEGVTNVYYQDSDGDSFGNQGVTIEACTVPTGYVATINDCDDTDPLSFPGFLEVCGDGIDQDCDGVDSICPDDGGDDSGSDGGEALDSDGDGVADDEDAFLSDPNESSDSDGDGIGDNADIDFVDDGDEDEEIEDSDEDVNEEENSEGGGGGCSLNNFKHSSSLTILIIWVFFLLVFLKWKNLYALRPYY